MSNGDSLFPGHSKFQNQQQVLKSVQQHKLTFIGAGNMARSLIGGLIADGYDPTRITAADPVEDQRSGTGAQFGIVTHADNAAAAKEADVVILAIKPQAMQTAAQSLADVVQTGKPLLISIAAGVRTDDLDAWLGGNTTLVRCMPNTPALVQSGATGLFATAAVTASGRDIAESILRAVGITRWVEEESLLDAVTAVSGSGPAYFFLVMEAIQAGAERLGLEPDTARLLTLQTALGAARMAMESQQAPGELRRRVTSPGGTTERAIGILEEAGLRDDFDRALTAARDRAEELAKIMSGQSERP